MSLSLSLLPLYVKDPGGEGVLLSLFAVSQAARGITQSKDSPSDSTCPSSFIMILSSGS